MKFAKLWDLLRYSERTTSKTPIRQKLAIWGKLSLRYQPSYAVTIPYNPSKICLGSADVLQKALFVSSCRLGSYLQSETKIAPDLRLIYIQKSQIKLASGTGNPGSSCTRPELVCYEAWWLSFLLYFDDDVIILNRDKGLSKEILASLQLHCPQTVGFLFCAFRRRKVVKRYLLRRSFAAKSVDCEVNCQQINDFVFSMTISKVSNI